MFHKNTLLRLAEDVFWIVAVESEKVQWDNF